VFDAVPHGDRELVELPEANHYFSGADQKSHLTMAADLVHDWDAPARVRRIAAEITNLRCPLA